ncbi:MAG: chemotaxis protein CheW [Campylobacterales bacterium]
MIDSLIFLIDDKKYSINMKCVRQVIETDTLNKTQSSSIVNNDNIEFIATWSNRAVNILKLDKALNLKSKKDNSQSIFIEYDKHIVAFMVQDIDNIIYLTEDNISETSSNEETIINGAILYNNEVIVRLNEKYIASMG